MYTDGIESIVELMSNCIDENYDYTAHTKSIDKLVAVDEKLEEKNTLRLDNSQFVEFSR